MQNLLLILDYGIDVIIIKDKIKTGIQAKCYGEGNVPLGLKQ